MFKYCVDSAVGNMVLRWCGVGGWVSDLGWCGMEWRVFVSGAVGFAERRVRCRVMGYGGVARIACHVKSSGMVGTGRSR